MVELQQHELNNSSNTGPCNTASSPHSQFYQHQATAHYNNLASLASETLLRPESGNNRSHSICIVPSSASGHEQSKPQSPKQTRTGTENASKPEIGNGEVNDKNNNNSHNQHQHHDNTNWRHPELGATREGVTPEDVNLNSKLIVRDKTSGLAHLDPHSILVNQQHAHQHQHQQHQVHHHQTTNQASLHDELYLKGSQIFYAQTQQPVSILSNGGGTPRGSLFELKQRNPNAEQGPAPHRRIVFETGPPAGSKHRLNPEDPNLDPIDGIVSLLSAIYCKILIVIGLCFPMAEVISHRIPISWYEGFYLYLYMGSILFLIFVYIFLLNRKRRPLAKMRGCLRRLWKWTCVRKETGPGGKEVDSDTERSRSEGDSEDDEEEEQDADSPKQIQCGSFYLRVGAVAFGVGSMIYSGLEFGQFFELESKEHCYSFMYGLTPGSHMIFTFIQLYFIFMNSRVIIARHKLIARFGLMHMIGTNICVWLHVLIQETKHQIMTMVMANATEMGTLDMTVAWDHIDDVVEDLSEDYFDSVVHHSVPHRPHGGGGGGHHAPINPQVPNISHLFASSTPYSPSSTYGSSLPGLQRVIRSLNDHSITHSDCRRSNIIGELVTDASQFLFPCTIEYSLICAAILYIMWKSISDMRGKPSNKANLISKPTSTNAGFVHQRHHYQVDCAKAHKGLFTGIFLMVICIISLILFFVFIKKEQFRNLAVLQAHIVELVIYCINAIACLIALFQVRELHYNRNRGVELDNILLIISQAGLCIFTMFSIIGAQFISQLQNTRLVLVNALACLIQATLQSVFILDASKRKASTVDQVRRKPGREMVTFLLVCNFSMWAINTLETRRAESNPVQMSFYGFWAWTIITHVTMPLTIFYRFHSTVCLCEIWKGTYKIKADYL